VEAVEEAAGRTKARRGDVVTKIAAGIMDRVYGSVSEEDWDVLQKYYNGSMEALVEDLDTPIPRLTVRVRALLELRRHSQEKENQG
jgi:hypothetical protein